MKFSSWSELITILTFYSRQIKIMWPKLISSSFSLVCSQLPKCLARNVTTTSARLGTFEPDYLDVSMHLTQRFFFFSRKHVPFKKIAVIFQRNADNIQRISYSFNVAFGSCYHIFWLNFYWCFSESAVQTWYLSIDEYSDKRIRLPCFRKLSKFYWSIS